MIVYVHYSVLCNYEFTFFKFILHASVSKAIKLATFPPNI